jgi:Tfp pilus assembly protein PilO
MVDTKTSKWQEYKYSIMVGVGSAFLLIILVFAVGGPLFSQFKKTNALLKEKRSVLAKLEEKLTNLQNLKSKEAEIKEKNAKVMAALPTDKDVSRLFVQFENIANQNGLSINSVQEGGTGGAAASDTASVRAVSYTVSATTADYGSLKNALAKLEEALRILSVSKVEANAGTQGVGLSVNLTVSTYLRAE